MEIRREKHEVDRVAFNISLQELNEFFKPKVETKSRLHLWFSI